MDLCPICLNLADLVSGIGECQGCIDSERDAYEAEATEARKRLAANEDEEGEN